VEEEHMHQEQRKSRRSIRLPDYDYRSSGAYFVTLCTHLRKPLFSNPQLKSILETQWNALPQRFVDIELDSFVIMPDHMHCIIRLKRNTTASPTLAQVIGAFKSLVAVAWLQHLQSAGMVSSEKIWQRNYYEHVIRNDLDLETKRKYIQNNPGMAKLKKEGDIP
jgi:putative transposase